MMFHIEGHNYIDLYYYRDAGRPCMYETGIMVRLGHYAVILGIKYM
jgi:hypothetical protein